jgi:uncharacterized protein
MRRWSLLQGKILVAMLCGSLAMVAHAIPPPLEQVAADCVAPTYATDQLVCADAELKEMDRVMRERLATLDPRLVRNPRSGY